MLLKPFSIYCKICQDASKSTKTRGYLILPRLKERPKVYPGTFELSRPGFQIPSWMEKKHGGQRHVVWTNDIGCIPSRADDLAFLENQKWRTAWDTTTNDKMFSSHEGSGYWRLDVLKLIAPKILFSLYDFYADIQTPYDLKWMGISALNLFHKKSIFTVSMQRWMQEVWQKMEVHWNFDKSCWHRSFEFVSISF